jgi:rubrerythrin
MPTAETANERLIRTIEAHVASEQGAINLYRRLQADLPDPLLAAIMRLIIEDEEHHHRALREVATGLRLGGQAAHVLVPRLDAAQSTPSVLRDVIAALDAAAEEEHRGASEFRKLAHSEEDQGNRFVALLLNLMALDSDKHERLLRFSLDEIRSGIQPPARPSVDEDRKE